ncbi:MAG: DNA repair protein RecN [Lachnospiraceae bacterium]|nr:DNA repair protein RecN [Lachnospiraceae bacterium]
MINNLHVKNLALIDEADVTFTPGLNILTGETGAGKSIIIGSLGLAMGARADLSSLRTGADSGSVELTLTPDDDSFYALLDEMGIEHEERSCIIRRRITAGGSDCHINGHRVTLKELSRICSSAIDICGQRESVTLLKESSLRNLLDDYGKDGLKEKLAELKATFNDYSGILSRLDNIETDESLRKRKADLAEYEINEIDEAQLKPGEDAELETGYRRLSNISRISESLSMAGKLLEGEEGAGTLISRALREIMTVSEYDDALSPIQDSLADLESMSQDLIHELRSYMDGSDYDPEEFAGITARLDLINHLKSKYGRSIEDILSYRDEKAEELAALNDQGSYILRLNADKERLHADLLLRCADLHDMRLNAARALEERLIDELKAMNFLDVRLEISVNADPGQITSNGYDSIDFNISMNPGEDPRPLSSVASGGELSRIMLAIKCVTGDTDRIGTLVFDEIDTGISGITSLKTGEKLHELSRTHQVICITHQAQVAAQADTHFMISKSVRGDRTYTDVTPLDHDGMIDELARMMGTDRISEAARSAAEELKNGAKV